MTVLNRLSSDLETQLERFDALWLKAAERGDMAEADRIFAESESMRALANSVRAAANRNAVAELAAVERILRAAVARQRRAGLGDIAAGTLRLLEEVFGRQPDLAPQGVAQDASPGSLQGSQQGTSPGATVGAEAMFETRDGQPRDVIEALIAASVRAGIDPMTTLTIVEIESDFKPPARPIRGGVPLSSAGGLFQITNDTWIHHGGRPNGAGDLHSHAAAASMAEQISVGLEIIQQNAAFVAQQLGGPASDEDIYIAHNQGRSGYDSLRLARPGDPVETAISPKAAKNNRLDGLTVVEALGRLRSLVLAARDDVLTRRVRVVSAPQSLAAVISPAAAALAVSTAAPGRSMAEKAARLATELRDTLAVTAGALRRESEEPLRSRIVGWFHELARDPVVKDDERWIRFKDPTSQPWSAIFISHLMRQSGVTKAQFPFSAAHSRYIFHALDRRAAGVGGVAFRRLDEAPLRVGDLVGAGRDTEELKNGVKRKIAALSVSEIENLHRNSRNHFSAHCDIVVAIKFGVAYLIGGNVDNTIGSTRINLDLNDRVMGDLNKFFILAVDF